jgi:hypothetical protein
VTVPDTAVRTPVPPALPTPVTGSPTVAGSVPPCSPPWDQLVPVPEEVSAMDSAMLDRAVDRIDSELEIVREWRAEQLRRLGVPAVFAYLFADRVDWHEVAKLVGRGCPPLLALRIVR